MELYLNRIVENSVAEGFGNRLVIWTQGCSIRCVGCANKETWEFGIGAKLDVDDIFSSWKKMKV